jgi:hypothetical protein
MLYRGLFAGMARILPGSTATRPCAYFGVRHKIAPVGSVLSGQCRKTKEIHHKTCWQDAGT